MGRWGLQLVFRTTGLCTGGFRTCQCSFSIDRSHYLDGTKCVAHIHCVHGLQWLCYPDPFYVVLEPDGKGASHCQRESEYKDDTYDRTILEVRWVTGMTFFSDPGGPPDIDY